MDTKKLTNILSKKLGRDAADIENCINALSDILVDCTIDGDTVSMPGFGSFEQKMRSERVATHPSTGKKLLVPPKLSIVFKPSAILKQKVRK